MTLEELRGQIESARWFANLGGYVAGDGQLALQNLRAWASEDEILDRYHEKIAEQMEWLPAQSQDSDPIHGDRLEQGEEGLAFYKLALNSLRSLAEIPALQVGPHRFQHVAVGAAGYACRRAAVEICAGQPGFWCGLVPLYATGQWPCGLLPDKTLVVF